MSSTTANDDSLVRTIAVPPGPLGLTVKRYGSADGALVTSVSASCAFGSSVRVGDRLVTINGAPIDTAEDLSKGKDATREVGVAPRPTSDDAADYTKGQLLQLRDLDAVKFRELDWEDARSKHGADFTEEMTARVTHKERWDLAYAALAEFQAEHGHCNVMSSDSSHDQVLGRWVCHQRQTYKKGTLAPARQERLEVLGFEWTPRAQQAAERQTKDENRITHNERWERRYEELALFHSKEGHCNVPNKRQDEDSLGGWVGYQRRAYKQNGGTLPGDRAARLEALGFSWFLGKKKEPGAEPDTKKRRYERWLAENECAAGGAPVTVIEDRWNRRFAELAEFRETNGHCNVPQKPKPERLRPLGKWVQFQRTEYKNHMGILPGDRVARLESLGFVWHLGRHKAKGAAAGKSRRSSYQPLRPTEPTRTSHEERWDCKFAELTRFKAEHGHCNVPNNPKKLKMRPLSQWVQFQRGEYRANAGKLAWNRVARLEGLGFNWELKPRREGQMTAPRPSRRKSGMRNAKWEEKYQQLVQFQLQHGHCNVSANAKNSNHEELKQLAYWVTRQRAEMGRRMLGVKTMTMTQERIQRLKDIGFAFQLNEKRNPRKPRRAKASNKTTQSNNEGGGDQQQGVAQDVAQDVAQEHQEMGDVVEEANYLGEQEPEEKGLAPEDEYHEGNYDQQEMTQESQEEIDGVHREEAHHYYGGRDHEEHQLGQGYAYAPYEAEDRGSASMVPRLPQYAPAPPGPANNDQRWPQY